MILPPLSRETVQEERARLRGLRQAVNYEVFHLRHLFNLIDTRTRARRHKVWVEDRASLQLTEEIARRFAKLAALEAEALTLAEATGTPYRRPLLRSIKGRR